MSEAINSFHIIPSYTVGFTFYWDMVSTFVDPLPWRFIIQQAPAPDGPWTDISPVLSNVMMWTESKTRYINKDHVLHFRLKLTTPKSVYISNVIMPYGEILNRREYGLMKEMLRKEVLRLRTSSGIIGKIWIRSTYGPVCTHCRDPFTKTVLDSACKYCFGTGREPGYHGPYFAWMAFSTTTRAEDMASDGTGTREPYTFNVRTIICPHLKDTDVIVDPCKDKRYYVDAVRTDTEMRRLPIVQTAEVHEAPVTEPIYKLGL